MASSRKIAAARRSDAGKGASRRLRRAGKVPAILYGNNMDPLNIEVDHEGIVLAAQNDWFYSSILDLDVDGENQRVLLRDWQVHPYKQRMLHLDFLRIDETREIHVTVPIHFLNQEESPAGKSSGIVITHDLPEVEVVCLSKDLPEHLEVDLGEFDEGDMIHLSELKLPSGVEIAALRQGEEHDEVVVSAHAVRAAKVADEEEDAETGEGEDEAEAGNEEDAEDQE